MAKKRGRTKGVTKSQAIRDYLAKNPGAAPKAIQAGLKKQGIAVSDGLISVVKYSKRGKKRRAVKRGAGRRRSAAVSRSELQLSDLIEARDFALRLGGVAQAIHALEALEKLQ